MTNRLFIFAILLLPSLAIAADNFPPIPRVLPPEGLEIPADVRAKLESRLELVKKRLTAVTDRDAKADVEVFTKAVELALLHREFYVVKDFAKADWALDEAAKRLDQLAAGESPWRKATGTVVQGYHSMIDGSAQPFGLVIPKDHNFTKPCPLYVWLHGRGDKSTDIHFLQERATKAGQIAPPGAIVVHPFGRHCVGWKHAGEIDVLEVVGSVKQRYKIDADRVVLIGFSMGGAGAWHMGAHYTNNWIAVSPGAGFVETKRYARQDVTKVPAYEQKLWGLYDVPDYVRNLFNTRVIAYSGELDKQRQAAVFMEDAYQAEGRQLEHLIGPGVEHKYEPETLKLLLAKLEQTLQEKNEEFPKDVHLQTRTLRYNGQKWIGVEGLEEHWRESRVDAKATDQAISIATRNANRLSIIVPPVWIRSELTIDGQQLGLLFPPSRGSIQSNSLHFFRKEDGQWKRFRGDIPVAAGGGSQLRFPLQKRPGVQGPIDDAFLRIFKVITPSGKSRNSAFQTWCDAELKHFQDRWRALMRADLPTVRDRDVDWEAMSGLNLIFWGDPDSNSALAKLVAARRLPVQFKAGRWIIGEATFDGNQFVPQLIYPDLEGLGGQAYFVLNSGLTFREGHDSTNSLQNPKLPDWAIIDITQPPDALTPGRIHDADFFDEQWQLKRQPKAP